MASIDHQRRRFLRALGTTAAALPFFSLLQSSAVQAQSMSPKRLVLVQSGYGGIWDSFRPRVTGNDAPLTAESLNYAGSALAPLAPFASKMLVLEGLSVTAGLMQTGPTIDSRTLYVGHDHSTIAAWTGCPIVDATDSSKPTGPSLDFALAQQLAGNTPVKTLQLGMGGYIGINNSSTMSFNASGVAMPSFGNPANAFDLLFSGGGGTSDPSALLRRKAVLNALQKDARRLQSRLAAPERQKLDEHLSALNDIDARISAPPPVSCTAPTRPQPSNVLDTVTTNQLSLVREALACDRTRFVSMAWNLGGNATPGLPENLDMHGEVAHRIEDMGAPGVLAREQMTQVQAWHAQKLADFAASLAATPDGDGSLLDHTLIIWTQDFGQEVHGGLNIPYVLLGGGAGFRMGRYLRVGMPHPTNWGVQDPWRSYVPHNKLLVSVMNGFGISGDTFGSTEFSGPLSGLT
ncbi:MAG: DUF1552 domain-containing protein [Archangium sp.]